MPRNANFTKREKSRESHAKSEVVSKFFVTWARIVGKYGGNRLVYADLFAGAGFHESALEGAAIQKGTALMSIDAIGEITSLHHSVQMMLNDENAESAYELKQAVESAQGTGVLASADVTNVEVTSRLYDSFIEQSANLPTFWFLDPTGWDGLSLEGIVRLTDRKYNDLIFFFSYENINRFIKGAKVQGSLQDLFGSDALRYILNHIDEADSPRMRERLIVSTLRTTLRQRGRLSECMKFGKPGSQGTSHFLILVTKDYTGRRVFLDIAKKASNWTQFGVPMSGYGTSATILQPSLFADHGFEDEIDRSLLNQFAGRTLTVKQTVENFFDPAMSLHRSFVAQSLSRLQSTGRVTVSFRTKDGQEQRGKHRLNDHCLVSFPASEDVNGK